MGIHCICFLGCFRGKMKSTLLKTLQIPQDNSRKSEGVWESSVSCEVERTVTEWTQAVSSSAPWDHLSLESHLVVCHLSRDREERTEKEVGTFNNINPQQGLLPSL